MSITSTENEQQHCHLTNSLAQGQKCGALSKTVAQWSVKVASYSIKISI